MEYARPGTYDKLEASARHIANPESEEDKTRRVLKVVQGPNWDFLTSPVSLDDNVFKTPSGKPHRYVDAKVVELPRIVPPDYDQPQNNAMAA